MGLWKYMRSVFNLISVSKTAGEITGLSFVTFIMDDIAQLYSNSTEKQTMGFM